jgi:hypothetical protein
MTEPTGGNLAEERGSRKRQDRHAGSSMFAQAKGRFNYILDRFIDWCDDAVIRAGLPGESQSLFQRAACWLGDVAFWLSEIPRSDVYYLDGPQWSVVCVGSEQTKNELCRILFPDTPQESGPERVALWQIPSAVHRWLADVDLVVLQHGRWQPWLPQTRYTFSIRPWIRQILDISFPKEAVIKQMHSERRRHWRKMGKVGYTFDFTRRLSDFDLFYHAMYTPYISARHTDRAIISPYHIYKLYFGSGGLILISHQAQPVAGVLCRAVGDVCQVGPLGVREEHSDLIQKELMLAIYWSTVEWAWERKLKIVDWNRSRAWQTDGVFRFKRYWGTQIVPDLQTHERWYFLANRPSPALQKKLNQVGFITEVDGQHYGILLSHEGELPADLDLERQQRVAHHDGLTDVLLVSPGWIIPLSQFMQTQA